jgi:hypothetical protein
MASATRRVARILGSTLFVLVFTFSALLTVAAKAGILGIPLAAILLSWFGKYVFVIIDTVAHGHTEPPVLSLDMVAPFANWRGLSLVAVTGSVWLLTNWFESVAGTAIAAVTRLLALATLPACVAIIAIESNPIKAMNPIALGRVIVGLGSRYLQLLGALLAAAVVTYLIGRAPLWLMLRIALDLSLVVALSWLLGFSLYHRRAALGIEAWRSPERTAERESRVSQREHAHFIDEIFGLVRSGSHTNAWASIERRLEQTRHADAEYDWLLDALQRLDDPRHLARLQDQYLERLVTARRGADGLKALERIWRTSPNFLPRDAAATLTLARIALETGSRRDARALLRDFPQRFAGHPSVPLAQALMAELMQNR